jgi:uncharacterized protein
MTTNNYTLTPQTARQLVIVRQHLDGHNSPAMLDVIRDLGCLQLDPISAVARSHQLVLWSRLGHYDLADLDRLLWEDHSIFEYWGHVASIVLTEEYPIHSHRMRGYPTGESSWAERLRSWIETPKVAEMRDAMMARLRDEGPLPARLFKDLGADFPSGTGWTSGNNAPRMLDYLWQTGAVMVTGRQGIQRLWDVSERCLPDWTPREEWDADMVTRFAAQKAIRALGVATPGQIKDHYTRRRYYDLERVLAELEAEGVIYPVIVEGINWKGKTYIHADDLPLVERIESGGFEPRTVLLSPFDNLICDRQRTEQLFDFYFRIEIYTPKVKRKYGYYVLPILQGDRLIGRIDPKVDRKAKTLTVNAVYAEDAAPDDTETVKAIRAEIESLAGFVGAETIVFGEVMPEMWKAIRGDKGDPSSLARGRTMPLK